MENFHTNQTEREKKIEGAIQTWRLLVNESNLDNSLKEKILVLVEDAGRYLGKVGNGTGWDKNAEKLEVIVSVAEITNQQYKDELKTLVEELILDMSRSHRSLLEQ